jgi:transposase-like protein
LGSQRFQCQACRRQYTPEPKPLGYDDKTKEAALKLYLEGNGFRRIGRLLSVNHQSVVNWVNAFHTKLRAKKQALPVPGQVSTLEMDELFTFIGTKKSQHSSSPSLTARRAASSRTRSASSGRPK